MPLLEYQRYRSCKIVRDDEEPRTSFVPEKFAKIGLVVCALKSGVDTPTDNPPDPEEWEDWTIESVGELALGEELSIEEKRQTVAEWRC